MTPFLLPSIALVHIVSIVDSAGNEVVKYIYDPWGKILSTSGSLASTLGTIQPFRYRGYVYDEETGLYYLRSRYYKPEWMRFLNSDTILNGNTYTYCSNSPIAFCDTSGRAFVCCYDENGFETTFATMTMGIGGGGGGGLTLAAYADRDHKKVIRNLSLSIVLIVSTAANTYTAIGISKLGKLFAAEAVAQSFGNVIAKTLNYITVLGGSMLLHETNNILNEVLFEQAPEKYNFFKEGIEATISTFSSSVSDFFTDFLVNLAETVITGILDSLRTE